MKITQEIIDKIQDQIYRISKGSGSYAKKYENICIKDSENFENLPFTFKEELREAYPMGLSAVPISEIVRIHSSSGTTGFPVIIPYTKQDVEDWAEMMKRCYELTGITTHDVIQITPGYGLWTAGIGFQIGAEKLGAMTIPLGPGNTDKQINFMKDLRTTVICATASYALYLAEEIESKKCIDDVHIKKVIIGSECWGDKTSKKITECLGTKVYDIYGLTEIYGPGIAISCNEERYMHYFNDYLYFEIIDPKTGKVIPDGEIGELVITTLKKEGAPLIRYRTHDLTRIIPKKCSCGCNLPRIDVILGRTDDMVKVRGVTVFPGQFDYILSDINHATSEYQLIIEKVDKKDSVILFVETQLKGKDKLDQFAQEVMAAVKSKVGIKIEVRPIPIRYLPRSEKKTKRIHDKRIVE